MSHPDDHDGHAIDLGSPSIVGDALAVARAQHLEPTYGITVLALPADLTLDQWADIGSQLRTAINSTPWWVGDWLIYAYTTFETDPDGAAISTGAAAVRVRLAELGFEHEQIERCRRVAAKFPPAQRREELSWAHHLEVAALDLTDANHLLNEALEHGWSTRELREHVRRHQAVNTTGQEALPGLAKPMRLSVRFKAVSDPAVLEEAATRIGAVLADLGLDGEVKVA